jgi:hypothetical protein
MHHHLRLYLFAPFCISFALTGISAAQQIEQFLPKVADRCAGDLEKRHQGDPPWDFTTNSRLPTPQQPTSYLHCIFNNDQKNVLDVDWLIPMVKQPVPAKSSALSPRYSDGPPLGRPDGCLIFGNLHDKSLKAQFWARPEDKDKIGEEDGKDCLTLKSASVKPERSKAGKRANSIAPFRVFLRSNPDKDSTLVAFEGITGLSMRGDDVYQSFVTYRLRDEKDEPPSDMASFTMAPRWAGRVDPELLLLGLQGTNQAGVAKRAGDCRVFRQGLRQRLGAARTRISGSRSQRSGRGELFLAGLCPAAAMIV